MSVIFVLYTDAGCDLLKSLRPAWAVQSLSKGLAYYREDQNTPWVKVDTSGTLDISRIPLAVLECLSTCKEMKIALITVKNRESIKDAILRGANLPLVESARNLAVDQAFSSDLIMRLRRK